MENHTKKAINLFKSWIACFIILCIGSNVYISYSRVIVGNDPTVFISGYHLFLAGTILLFFIPLLCVIRYFAKMSTSAKLHKTVTIILIWLAFSEGLLLLSIVFAYIAPEFFATLT